MNEIIQQEKAVEIFGVPARAHNVVADNKTGRILNQKIKTHSRFFTEDETRYKISAELSFDDECNNGHEDFSITGSIYQVVGSKYREHSFGCLHDDIAKHFPELQHLIKWHLVGVEGPMHYLANTLYHASNRDHWGHAPGEVSAWEYGVRFGGIPVTHPLKQNFWKFLKERHGTGDFQVIALADEKEPKRYVKFTFVGFGDKWYECPFDNSFRAEEFAYAMNNLPVNFVKLPSQYSEGKERELDHARSSAVWPEATDEQLCLPREELKALLEARLPQLLADFKKDMLEAGFLWPGRS